MFRSDARIIKSCGNRIYRSDLSVFILAEIRFHTMENSQTAGCNGCCCFRCIRSPSCCLATDQLNRRIVDKVIKCANSIGTAAYAGKHCIRKLSFFFHQLFLDLLGDNCLEISYDGWERMWSHNRTKAVMGVADAVGPLSEACRAGIL